MLYLNAVQQVDQNELIKILPVLCTDLKNGSPGNTLDKYHVEWTHKNGETNTDHTIGQLSTVSRQVKG